MKLWVMVGTLSVSLLGLAACEENSGEPAKPEEVKPVEAAKPAEAAPEAAKPPEVPPKQVCDEAVAAAKAKDEAKVLAHVAGELAADAKPALLAFLTGAKCGEPKVDGEKAVAPLTVGTGKKAKTRELPMIKSADGWKIDGAVWLEKNPLKKAKTKKAKTTKKR
jgi:hypothetical protein